MGKHISSTCYYSLPIVTAVIDFYLLIGFAQCVLLDSNQVLKYQIGCLDESQADPNDILEIKSGNWRIYNTAIQKWALCILVRAGIMTSQGVFKVDEALENIPEAEHDKIMKQVDICLYKKKRLPHEIAWNYMKCFNKKHPHMLKILYDKV